MSEKKVVSRNIAIGLGIIVVILLACLGGVILYYTNYLQSIAYSNQDVHKLQNQINQLQDQIDSLVSERDNLWRQIDSLKAPKLIKVDLEASDSRPFLQTPYLYVYGYICNVGTNPAYNSKIHVVAYQSGGVVAIDTYITLGTIYGESWTSVDSKVYYSGSELVDWTLTLEWTS